jgi:hypothetical protein
LALEAGSRTSENEQTRGQGVKTTVRFEGNNTTGEEQKERLNPELIFDLQQQRMC